MKNILKRFVLVQILLLCLINSHSQDSNSIFKSKYNGVYSEIEMMLKEDSFDFKRAVYLTENIYYEDELDENAFYETIRFYSSLSKGIMDSGDIEYVEKDKNTVMSQCAVFVFMTDTISISFNNNIIQSIPFTYNYEDFSGQKDWSNMFVSKLMETNKGNCHSLPYLYKMIMDELGQECHLALAPNHIYIKANNKKVGWYNIELTCADFPTDAWLMASGYIHLDAIRNKVYMKALTDKESVAMTLVDLAQGYQAKFGLQDGSFILKCCDTALEHFPNYINALLLKTETLTALYKQTTEPEQKEMLFTQMNETATMIHELGYRKMPSEMYAKWLGSLKGENTNERMKAVVRKK